MALLFWTCVLYSAILLHSSLQLILCLYLKVELFSQILGFIMKIFQLQFHALKFKHFQGFPAPIRTLKKAVRRLELLKLWVGSVVDCMTTETPSSDEEHERCGWRLFPPRIKFHAPLILIEIWANVCKIKPQIKSSNWLSMQSCP